MRKIAFYSPLALILWASISLASEHLNIMGRAETGKLMDQNVELEVKMDTGALTASLSAQNIKVFKKDGQDWVSFTLNDIHFKTPHHYEYPLKRTVSIKKRQAEVKSSGADFESRPVVAMDLCLGDEIKRIDVSLADRSNFKYPMLLGRTAMEQFGVLIDPMAINTVKPTCTSPSTGTKTS
ncbi:MAG: ATP-dependent zinc protease [Gammaproteobacteria bacterium]|jgi:hypothetical protein